MKRNKYNVSHIKLLKMIKKGKLKENTRIYISDCPECFIWKKGTLYFHGEPANFKMFIENIEYAKFKIGDDKNDAERNNNKWRKIY